jgi:hypothetical protein
VARWNALRQLTAGALVIAALFAVLQAVDYRQDLPSNDTYQYARQTLRFLGHSQASAVHGATEMFCRDAGTSAVRSATLDDGNSSGASAAASGYAACMQTYRNGLTPSSPRYIAIFTSRPGYPLLSALFAGAFGLRLGLWLAAMLCTLLAGALVVVLLRSAGAGVPAALGGQALYLAAPTGYWGSRMLTDGPALAATLLALLGAWWLTRGLVRRGAVVLAAGMVAGFLFRYSSETLVAAALCIGAVICLRFVAAARHRGTVWLAALAGGGAVASQLVSTALGWPGIAESMQDTFTKHFIRPDVPHPIGRLLALNLRFWVYFPVLEPTSLLLLLGLVVVGVALWRRDPVFGALVTGIAATGIGTVAAHPLASQADRLMVAVWLLIVLGVPLVASPWTRRAGRAENTRADADTGNDTGKGTDTGAGEHGTSQVQVARSVAEAVAR